jgi:hypothetical protein
MNGVIDNICHLPVYQHASIIFAAQLCFAILEAWLGKTNKVKAGSVLELVYDLVKQIFGVRRKEDNNEQRGSSE